MTQLILFNKPYLVLSQFTDESPRATHSNATIQRVGLSKQVKPFQQAGLSPELEATTPLKTPRQVLKNYIDIPRVYVAGRLDYDSEGLLLLTDDGKLQAQISHPRYRCEKVYLAQVEGVPSTAAIDQLRTGILLKDGLTAPATAQIVPEPDWLWSRTPPIRYRAAIPTTWVELTITEGRNRQVRRMTAAIGHPTLRLIRIRIGAWTLNGLAPGQYQKITIPTP